MLGIVKWFNNDKGFGLAHTKIGEDVFIHYSNIKIDGYKYLSKNQVINFDICAGNDGFYAKNVIVVKDVND